MGRSKSSPKNNAEAASLLCACGKPSGSAITALAQALDTLISSTGCWQSSLMTTASTGANRPYRSSKPISTCMPEFRANRRSPKLPSTNRFLLSKHKCRRWDQAAHLSAYEPIRACPNHSPGVCSVMRGNAHNRFMPIKALEIPQFLQLAWDEPVRTPQK